MAEDDSGDQLVSFFLYSLFIYPVTNYLVSPQRKYSRWRAIFYAVAFLGIVTTVHIVSDKPLNTIVCVLTMCLFCIDVRECQQGS